MPETARLWIETSLKIIYLVMVWWLVIAMFSRRFLVAANDRKTAVLILWAF